jgi:hypothetical protein
MHLRNKQFVFRNKQLTKEEYDVEIKKIDFADYETLQNLKKEFDEMVKSSFHRFAYLTNTVDTTGNSITNSQSSHNVFDGYDLENTRHAIRLIRTHDVMDVVGGSGELIYEVVASGMDTYGQKFSMLSQNANDSEYCDWCITSNNLFGCVGLRKEEFCILNKKYKREEFLELRKKIIEHTKQMPYVDKMGRKYSYGEFFPIELSVYAYNEGISYDHLPLTKEQCLEQGYKWHDEENASYHTTMTSKELPKAADADVALTKAVIACENEGHAYKIIQKELEFLKSKNLPLPRFCPKCRARARFEKRLPFKLWKRNCTCQGSKDSRNKTEHFHKDAACSREFMTPYSTERPESVYCEDCYTSEVV